VSAESGVWAVLVAAGQGERFGGDRPKAFAKLRERPLLAESLERLDRSDWIESIVIVAPPEWEEPSILVAEELSAGKVHSAVTGGSTRAESVRAGLEGVPDNAAVVLVHDAARPILPEEVVERVVAGLEEGWDGVAPGLRVVETVDRTGLVAVQTPQVFMADVLRRAHASGGEATDCAGLVEAAGGRVRIVEGDPRLLKVTTQADLDFAEALLRAEP
jgi:2-C-methyl-D-erythritol 4-phosphate cytidylyltransferase